jgi:hypothetical protein
MRLMEQIVSRENMMAAYRRGMANKGAPGIDKISVEQLKPYLKELWPRIKEELLAGQYRPALVRGVEILKPGGKGMRLLGIPIRLSYCTLLRLRSGRCGKTGGVGNPFAQRMVRFGGDGDGVGHFGLLSMGLDEACADPFIDHPMRYAVTLLDLGDT